MEPWIKLYRKFKDWEWYGDVVVTGVFIHLLLSANWKPKKWKGITIDTGELVTSIATLADELNISVQQTRTALDRLQSSKVINKQTTNKYTLIKVLNYCKYQGSEISSNKQINNQTTNEQQTNNKQTTTPKEIENKRNNSSNNNTRARVREDLANAIQLYEQNIGVPSPLSREILRDLLSSHSADLVELAIEEAVKANARNLRYIEGIIHRWDDLGVKTKEDAKLAVAEHKFKKQNAVSAKKGKSDNDRAECNADENQQQYGTYL